MRANSKGVKFDYKSPDDLEFDPSNPRLAGKMNSFTQEKIQKEIFGEPYYASELVDSFLENGYIDYEPLVVKQNKDKFTVIEGNRRLAAIKEILANPDKYKSDKIEDLKSIPVLVFPENSDDDQTATEMRVYLGVRHLLGFREWPPYAKAQFLETESKKPGGLSQVLKETRLTRTAAKRLLIPFRILQKTKEKIPKGEDFSNLSEALSRSGTISFLELEIDSKTLEIKGYDKAKLALLFDDLYGKKTDGARDSSKKIIYDTRDISAYSKVLNSKKASMVLHSGKSLAEAEIYIDSSEESLKRLEKASKQIKTLLTKITQGGKKSPEDLKILTSYKKFDEDIKQFISKKS